MKTGHPWRDKGMETVATLGDVVFYFDPKLTS